MTCDPVGPTEIAERLNVTKYAVDRWRQRPLDFPEPTWTISGHPVWDWPVVEKWAKATKRL